MKTLLKSSYRPWIVCLASAIVLFSVLTVGGNFAVPAARAAAMSGTVHPKETPIPACIRPVTVTSKPCGAMIYIDGIQVGRTPMSFPMPTGRYTLVLLAPGHEHYVQRILVPDAPLEIDANLLPKK